VPKLVHVRVTLIIYAVENLRFKVELRLESSYLLTYSIEQSPS